MLTPGECSAWAIRSAATNSGWADSSARTTISLARPGSRWRPGRRRAAWPAATKMLPGPTIMSTGRHALDAVGQGRHRLGAADAVDFGDAQLVADGQQVAVVGAVRRRRHDRRRSRSTPAAWAGHDGHQQRRWIGRRPAGDADADAAQRPIAQTAARGCRTRSAPRRVCSRPSWNDRTFWRTRGSFRGRRGRRPRARSASSSARDAQRLGVQPDLVELLGVVQTADRPRFLHVGANARRPCAAAALRRRPPASASGRRAITMAAWLENCSRKRGELLGGVRGGAIDPPKFERRHSFDLWKALHPISRRALLVDRWAEDRCCSHRNQTLTIDEGRTTNMNYTGTQSRLQANDR